MSFSAAADPTAPAAPAEAEAEPQPAPPLLPLNATPVDVQRRGVRSKKSDLAWRAAAAEEQELHARREETRRRLREARGRLDLCTQTVTCWAQTIAT